jgi:hypothetical protein
LEPIFDVQGQVIAWLYEQRFVIDLSNRYRAFVRDGEVWSPGRRHLGQFANGFFWEKQGKAVAFMRGASTGPSTPAPQVAPEPPRPTVPPIPPLPSLVSPVRAHSRSWSSLTFEALLGDSSFPERPERRRPGKRLGARFRGASPA